MYIVTGGAGFIGNVVVGKLNQLGIKDIIIVDELGESAKWKNLINKRYRAYYHKDDFLKQIRNESLRDGTIESIKAIIHMGASSSTTVSDMDYLMDNNFHYSQELARFSVHNNIRFIYASSAATYGAGENGYVDNEDKLEDLRPLNRYGYSKQIFDLWAKDSGLLDSIVGLKFFNVYGPNEYHKGSMLSVPYRAYQQVKESGKIKLFKSYREDYKDGEQKRDFIYVKDCVESIIWLMENPDVNGVYNLGTGSARSWNDLARSVFSAMGIKENIEYIEMPENLIEHYQYYTQADMQAFKQTGCPVKFHSLEDGVRDYVCEFLSQDNPFY